MSSLHATPKTSPIPLLPPHTHASWSLSLSLSALSCPPRLPPFLPVPGEHNLQYHDGTKIHRWETADAGLTLKDIHHSVSMLTRFRACRPERALARRGNEREREREREKGREGSGRTA